VACRARPIAPRGTVRCFKVLLMPTRSSRPALRGNIRARSLTALAVLSVSLIWLTMLVDLNTVIAAGRQSPSLQGASAPVPVKGIGYSPFRDCQNPNWGPYPTEDQIRQDMLLLPAMGNAIRTYSSTGVQASIPGLAREVGLRVSAGHGSAAIRPLTSKRSPV
jgi:exo-beta-1,3-glucanase (GH17 family)